jgi:hypothetical protein
MNRGALISSATNNNGHGGLVDASFGNSIPVNPSIEANSNINSNPLNGSNNSFNQITSLSTGVPSNGADLVSETKEQASRMINSQPMVNNMGMNGQQGGPMNASMNAGGMNFGPMGTDNVHLSIN